MSARPLRFWLACAAVGLLAAMTAATVGAVALSLMAGFAQWGARGLSLFTVANAAKGLTLGLVYLGFFALFVVPFAMALVPVAYAAATRATRDEATGRVLFTALAMLGGTFGPLLLEQALVWLHIWRGFSSGVRPLQLSELFIPFGLLAAPVGAWFIWPVLRRLEERMRLRATPAYPISPDSRSPVEAS